ncbi:MAG: hypothetical protein VW625_09470, partial [Perlucidibaca sp.]
MITLLATAGLSACGGGSSGGATGSAAGDVSGGSTDTSACARSSWVAGTTELCRGALVYRDYLYDDYGADTGLISPDPALLNLGNRAGHLGSPIANTPSLLAPTAGDKRYPAGLENTADLV